MPGYFPQARHSERPWRARVKRDGIDYHLGYFATKEEASDREKKFAERWPSRRGKYRD